MTVNFWFWVRAFAMCCGLVATITAIRNLNQFKDEAPANAVNLCPTRISVIVTPDLRVEQNGMIWFRRIAGRLEELDPIAVEKWFGRHCMVDAEPAQVAGGAKTVAIISFVTGMRTTLTGADGTFRWQDKEFKSAELSDALKTLADLPVRLRPSR